MGFLSSLVGRCGAPVDVIYCRYNHFLVRSERAFLFAYYRVPAISTLLPFSFDLGRLTHAFTSLTLNLAKSAILRLRLLLDAFSFLVSDPLIQAFLAKKHPAADLDAGNLSFFCSVKKRPIANM
jgi:hypothetical protein